MAIVCKSRSVTPKALNVNNRRWSEGALPRAKPAEGQLHIIQPRQGLNRIGRSAPAGAGAIEDIVRRFRANTHSTDGYSHSVPLTQSDPYYETMSNYANKVLALFLVSSAMASGVTWRIFAMQDAT